MKKKFILFLLAILLICSQTVYGWPPSAPNPTAGGVGGTADDIALTADGDFGDYDIYSVDGLLGVDDDIYIDMGTDGYLILEADTAISSTSVFTLIPDGVGSSEIISIVPSAALTTANAIWKAINIDGDALDPSSTDQKIIGIEIDLSGVVPSGSGLYMEGLELKMPDITYNAIDVESGHVMVRSATPNTITSIFPLLQFNPDINLLAATSEVHAVDVSVGETPAGDVVAVGVGSNVDVIHQHTGTYSTPDQTSTDAESLYEDGGAVAEGIDGNEVFKDVNDYIWLGQAQGDGEFDSLQVVFGTAATKDCFLTFYYINDSDNEVQFYPIDNTNGFRQTGTIVWDPDDFTAWKATYDPDAGDSEEGYWIKIYRTRVNDPGSPTPTTIKTLTAVEYSWDKNGSLNVNTITTTGGIIDTSGSTLTVGATESYATIALAMAAASSGDTILVAEGTYDEAVVFSQDNLTLKAVGSSDNTTITQAAGTTVSFGTKSGCVLDGFTVDLTAATANTDETIFSNNDSVTDFNTVKNCSITATNAGGSTFALTMIDINDGGFKLLNNAMHITQSNEHAAYATQNSAAHISHYLGNNLTITHNDTTGHGSYGFFHSAATSTMYCMNNIIDFNSTHAAAGVAYIIYASAVENYVSGNEINAVTTGTGALYVLFTGATDTAWYTGNQIYATTGDSDAEWANMTTGTTYASGNNISGDGASTTGGTVYESGNAINGVLSVGTLFTDPTFTTAITIGTAEITEAEAGYLEDVTSSVQDQIDAKQALDADLTGLAANTLVANLNLNGKLPYEATETTFAQGACPTVDLATARREIIFNNSGSTPTTISAFSNAVTGVWYHVTFEDDTFTVDFTGTNFYGHGGLDWEPRANDSAFFMTQDGTKFNWIVSAPTQIAIDQYYTLPFNPYDLSEDSWVGPTQPGRAGEALAAGEIAACRTVDATKPCYWYKYNAVTGDGDKLIWPRGIVTETITAAATEGSLVVGEVYILTDWITTDDFTNVGAASNADGVIFTATGTTPTTWTNSSIVNQLGNIGSGHGYFRNDTWAFTPNQDEGKAVWASDTTDGGILLAAPTDAGDQLCILGHVLDAGGYVGEIIEFNFTGLCAEE